MKRVKTTRICCLLSSTNIERDTIHASMVIEVLKRNLGTCFGDGIWDLYMGLHTSYKEVPRPI